MRWLPGDRGQRRSAASQLHAMTKRRKRRLEPFAVVPLDLQEASIARTTGAARLLELFQQRVQRSLVTW